MKNKRTTLTIGKSFINWIANKDEVLLYEKKIGGASLNVAIAINLFGGKTKFYSAVGNDSFGREIKNYLESKIDTSNIIFKENIMKIMFFISIDENGNKLFEFNLGANKKLHSRDISKIDMKKSEIYLFSGAIPLIGCTKKITYEYLLEYGIKHNKFIAFDPNYRSFLWNRSIYKRSINY